VTAGVSVGIRNLLLLNTSLQGYRYTELLGTGSP